MHHSDYVPLHLHTEYSLLDGAIKIRELIDAASHYRMPAVAITDHGNLFGAIEFYQAAIKAGLKPIIGCEVYVAPDSRLQKRQSSTGENAFHLILLARDLNGYRNLVTLVSKAYLEGFYYKPRIDIDLLTQYSGGLIGLSSCLHGEVPYYVSQGLMDKARESALKYKRILGPENFFLELQANGIKAQDDINRKLYQLSKELHIGVVATNDCHYLRREDARAHDILLCIQTGKNINTGDRLRFETDQLYFKSPEEMKREFSDIPEAILNTREIAERCNLEFHLGGFLLPRFQLEGEVTPEGYLEELAGEGLRIKKGSKPAEHYTKRLEYELTMIKKMGFDSYFLIVWDFIKYAKSRGIPVGPGRGSAAGSLVAYCLGITEIDPIRYNLLFERFLNPERISMPDIDVDFCKDRRNEVIEYVSEKYGNDHVAQIITFGTMAAKAVIRDVGRALDIPYAEVDRIAKMVPEGTKVTIDSALATEPKLKDAYDSNPTVRELIDIAKRLEGLSRHASTHAAGVVISPTPLTDYTPLYKNPSEETITTQFSMKSIEDIGLLKFDFLGLKTLTVIERTLSLIRDSGAELQLADIQFDDENTYRLLSSGQTIGIFQLESSGMRDILIRLQPNRFEDLIALVALYRPGPMAWIDDYIKRKRGESEITYELPEMKEILDETYGIFIYQEQVMMVANKIANFTMGQADTLRKAMGKKKPEEMERQKEAFIKGAVANDIPEEKARRIFEVMEPFAMYGFNKSHSAAYAYLAYQTAYLKAYYPVEFMAANLSLEENTDKMVNFINECRLLGIDILPPDINLSSNRFKVVGNSIRFGLEAVKGVGASAVQQIIHARDNSPFESVEDFIRRIDARKVNRKVIESLIKAGAFDSLMAASCRGMRTGQPGSLRTDTDSAGVRQGTAGVPDVNTLRATAWEMTSRLLDNKGSLYLFGQQSIFGETEAMEDLKPWTDEELLIAEKDSLGFYITGHPINRFRRYLGILGVQKTPDLEGLNDGAEVIISGVVTILKKSLTKGRSEPMAMLIIEDDHGTVECIAFPDVYREHSDLLVKNNLIIVGGTLDRSEKGNKVLIKEVSTITDRFLNRTFRIELSLTGDSLSDDTLEGIKGLLSRTRGNCPVYLRLRTQGQTTLIATEYNIVPDFDIIDSLEMLLGEGSISFRQNNGTSVHTRGMQRTAPKKGKSEKLKR